MARTLGGPANPRETWERAVRASLDRPARRAGPRHRRRRPRRDPSGPRSAGGPGRRARRRGTASPRWPVHGALVINLRNILDAMDEVAAASPLDTPPRPLDRCAGGALRARPPDDAAAPLGAGPARSRWRDPPGWLNRRRGRRRAGTSGTPPASWCGRPEPNQFVAAECADLPPGRALDLAAGEGRNAIWLARRGWQVTAVDFSQVAPRQGRPSWPATPPSRWVRADATTWRAPAAVDLVVVAYLQLPGRGAPRGRMRNAAAALGPAAPSVVAHDSTQPRRGHRRPAGPGGAVDRGGRAGRPRRRRRRGRSARDGSPGRWPPRRAATTTSTAASRGGRRGLPGTGRPHLRSGVSAGSAARCGSRGRCPDLVRR